MLKSQEIAWLESAIETLGPDSYIGATLFDQRELIERDIQNDIFPLQIKRLRADEHAQREATRKAQKELEDLKEELRKVQGEIRSERIMLEASKKARQESIEQIQTALYYATKT